MYPPSEKREERRQWVSEAWLYALRCSLLFHFTAVVDRFLGDEMRVPEMAKNARPVRDG